MSLLRGAMKFYRLIRAGNQNQGLSLLLRDSRRAFSTEAEQPSQDGSSGSFFETPVTGLAYGRLTGITKYTTKNDVISLLDECNLTPDDIKVLYNRFYDPITMMIQFPSRYAYDAGFRTLVRKGRLYRLERGDRSQWDGIRANYGGKTVLLQGIPHGAAFDDIERFLSGCQFDSNMQIFSKQEFPDPIRMALVQFPSRAQAMNAFITKNRGFCLNNRISMKVLE